MQIMPEKSVFSEADNGSSSYSAYFQKYEKLALNFIKKNLMRENGGIISNTSHSKSGSDILSESTGLFMDYSVIKGDRKLFDRQYGFLKERLLSGNNLVKWKSSQTEINCNAAIDDLRIVRALLDAYALWGDRTYFDTAGAISGALYSNQVKDGCLYELYDWKYNTSKKSIPLCYLDLYTIDRASLFNEGWGEVVNRGLNILKNGRVNDESPFYYKYYDYATGKYSLDEEFSKEKGICLTYTLYTVLHLAEMNEDTGFFTEWLRNEDQKGRLLSWYNPFTLKPVNEMESTAVYALAAVYSKKAGEEELYRSLMEKMLKLIITYEKSPYHGGFGIEATGSFFSFDNLTALWALGIR